MDLADRLAAAAMESAGTDRRNQAWIDRDGKVTRDVASRTRTVVESLAKQFGMMADGAREATYAFASLGSTMEQVAELIGDEDEEEPA